MCVCRSHVLHTCHFGNKFLCLVMPRDGCKECSRRRIVCDKNTPQCQKCIKKGISCTGIGIHYRFVAAKTAVRTPRVRVTTERAVEHWRPDLARGIARKDAALEQLVLTNSRTPAHTECSYIPREDKHTLDPAADLMLEIVRPGVSRLFNHCMY